MTTEFKFRIDIGDWSGDGHGKCDHFMVSSNKPTKDVREAYFAAKEKLPDTLCPESFVSDYEDYTVPDEVVEAGERAGCELLAALKNQEYQDFHTSDMADYVLWFLKQGDPELQLKRIEDSDSLAFYGEDEKGRHIGFIGYGLLGG
jgi:hypothetical protein